VPIPDVGEHALRLRCLPDGLPGDRIEAVDLDDVPPLRFGVEPGTALVGLGTLTTDLVFRRDTDPDADTLFVGASLLHKPLLMWKEKAASCRP
jgi:hypothetical protein